MGLELFKKVAKIFNDNGYRLFVIGGTTRDYLLGLELTDYDFVTDATPDEMKTFLPDATYTFAKYGSVRVKVDGTKIDITTLRVEEDYIDHRHPGKIRFIKDINQDYLRRDFTVNAIYLDEELNIIDPSNGKKDLDNKVIRFIGDPEKRVKEDPLRILRAKRFAKRLGFTIEKETLNAIDNLSYLLNELNPDKIKEEERKTNLK